MLHIVQGSLACWSPIFVKITHMATYASLLRVKLTNSFLVFLYGIACSWFGRYIANGKKEKKIERCVCGGSCVQRGEYFYILLYTFFEYLYTFLFIYSF